MDQSSSSQELTSGFDNRENENRTSETPNQPVDKDPQSGRQKEPEIKIQIKTADTPKILSARSKVINGVRGEALIGGQFEITYKYAINNPDNVQGRDVKKPEEYGKIVSLTPGNAFTDTRMLGLVGEPKVKVNNKNETVEVEKTERYQVKEGACPKPGTCAINFKIVVSDPVNTDKVAELKSVTSQTLFDKNPLYIPVRNPGRERGSGNERGR